MKTCTLWYRLVRDKQGRDNYEFNHLEDGHAVSDIPDIKVDCSEQRAWSRSAWKKEFALLTNDGRVVKDFDEWKPGRELW